MPMLCGSPLLSHLQVQTLDIYAILPALPETKAAGIKLEVKTSRLCGKQHGGCTKEADLNAFQSYALSGAFQRSQ